jgi:sporulation protein YlmC with PRC-barrel domain
METLKPEKKGLYKIKDIKNYKIEKSDSDIIGWNVFSSDKKSIGIIDDILVDPDLQKESYLDIYLHSDIKIKNDSRHLFVPAGRIKLDPENQAVYLLNIKTVISLRKTEDSEKENVQNPQDITSRDYTQSNYDNFYNNKLFDESNFHKSKEKKLYKLKELNSPKIFDNFPDIRQWCVLTSDHIDIGQVYDILIDKEINKVRYLDIKIYEGPIFDTERHILVPVGLAELGVDNDNKIMIKVDSNTFVNYPPYKGQAISDYEDLLINSLNNNDPW